MIFKNSIENNKMSGFYKLQRFITPVILPILTLLILLLVTVNLKAATTDQKIIIIYQKAYGFSQQLIDQLNIDLTKTGYKTSQMSIDTEHGLDSLDLLNIKKQNLVISIGSKTTQSLLKLDLNKPILSALIPLQIYKSLKKKYSTKADWSSLVIDHPLERQFYLISAIMGSDKKTGIILGPYTKDLNEDLINASNRSSQKIKIEEIENTEQLTPSLKSLSRTSDVLLTLPDPGIYNKATIRGILLLSYRKKLPIIGFSHAYVKAGAIAAVYSKPEQISLQLVNITQHFMQHSFFDKKRFNPNDFSVAINRNIARSLGIKIASDTSIIKHIKIAEKRK